MKKLLLIVVLIYCFKRHYCQSCPYFEYIRHNGETVGKIEFENDFSGDYQIEVNLTLAVYLNDKRNVRLDLRSREEEIIDGSSLVYYAHFPIQNPLPRPTRILFNRRVYCVSQPEQVRPGRGVTSYWASHSYTTGRPVRRRQGPISSNTIPSYNTLWTQPQTPRTIVTRWTPPTQRTIATQWTPQTPRTVATQWTPQTPRTIVTQWTPPTQRITVTQRPPPTPRTQRVTQAAQVTNSPPRANSGTSLSEPGCGVASSGYGSLIAGKDMVTDGQFPWMVGLMYKTPQNENYKYRCTGSIVSPRHVITAAHCIQLYSALYIRDEDLLVVLNKVDLQDWFIGSIRSRVSNSVINPQYVPNNGDGDIAVMTLTDTINFKYVKPICLWEEDEQLDRIVQVEGTVAGWGSDETGKAVIAEAKYVRMPVVSQLQCLQSNPRFYSITSNRTFCAGKRDGTGPCNGDSGAGFMIERDGRWLLRGIVSRALNDVQTCDLENYFVFADLAKAADWLKSVIRNS